MREPKAAGGFFQRGRDPLYPPRPPADTKKVVRVATQPLWPRIAVFRVGQNIGNLNCLTLKQDSPVKLPRPGANERVL